VASAPEVGVGFLGEQQMMTRLLAMAVSLALLAGCGGGFQGGLGPLDHPQAGLPAEPDELLAEELSAQRLEELYAKSRLPGWDPALEEELRGWEHRSSFDLPIQVNRQVRAYLVYFSTERKDKIRLYLSRSSRYLPMIKETFREHGLPEDLAYLALIESGFNPDACSPAGACGLWQFIRSTGRRYGLEVNDQVDERRDPRKSTRAAARYLSDLYRQFGSWYLAAASYNCGEKRVERELSRNHHQNFWQLSAHQCLPEETKNYVPQMIAATIIAKNPAKFGFTNIAYQPPLRPDEMQGPAPATRLAAAPARSRSAPAPAGRQTALARARGGKAAVKAPPQPEVRAAAVLGSSPPRARQAPAAKEKSKNQKVAAWAQPGKTAKQARKPPAAMARKADNHKARTKTAKKGEPRNAKGKMAGKHRPGPASAT